MCTTAWTRSRTLPCRCSSRRPALSREPSRDASSQGNNNINNVPINYQQPVAQHGHSHLRIPSFGKS